MSTPASRINTQIAELIKSAQADEIVEILTGTDPVLLSRNNQNQNQNQNKKPEELEQ